MTTYVALLRAVNVGGRTVTMQTVRDALSGAGFENVRTYVQSGNAVFSSGLRSPTAVTRAAEAAISAATGLDVPVVLRSAADLGEVVAANPFLAEGKESRFCYVTFLRDRVAAPKASLIDRERYLPDTFALAGREVFLYFPNGYGKTKLHNGLFEQKLGSTATTRNWSTVTKLADMARG
jgi:uncharacterized protein (DUF1697 family)